MTITNANIDRALRVVLLSMSRHEKHEWNLKICSKAINSIMEYTYSINRVINEQLRKQIISGLIHVIMAYQNHYKVSPTDSNYIL